MSNSESPASRPLVTVGLPTYNRAALLDRAARSVLAQDYGNVELIIADNASTDETEALCRMLAKQDSRVRYVRHAVNRGATANFNAVLELSRGQMFMWLGDDDWLDPGYVSACARTLAEQPGAVLAAGRCRFYDADGAFEAEDQPTYLLQDSPAGRVLAYYATVGYNSIFFGLMRTELARQIRLRNILSGDWCAIAQMALHGKVVTVEGACIHRTQGPSRMLANIVRSAGLPAFQARIPHLTIAFNSALFLLKTRWPDETTFLTRLRTSMLVFIIHLLRYSRGRRIIRRRARTAFIDSFAR